MKPCLSRRALIAGLAASSAAMPAVARAAGKQPAPDLPLVVGSIFPFSGPLALVGDEAFRGVTLAVDAINRAGGVGGAMVRLLHQDAVASADAEGAVKALVAQGAGLILGTGSSALSFAASAASELANIDFIELDASADAITTRGFKGLFRTGLNASLIADQCLRALTGMLLPGWHLALDQLKLVLLFDEGASDGSFAAAMLKACQNAGLPVLLSIGYGRDAMDLTAQVGRMKRAAADVVIHAGQPNDVLTFYQALEAAAWRPRMIIGAGSGYGLGATSYALGKALEGTMVVGPPLYAAQGASSSIAAAYMRRYAVPPRGAESLTCYVGTDLVLRTLNKAGNKAGGKAGDLPAALAKLNLPAGALANGWGAGFSQAGQNQPVFATIQQWQDGALKTIDVTITPHVGAKLSLG